MSNTLPKTTTKFLWYFIKKQKLIFVMGFLHLAWAADEVAFPFAVKMLIDAIASFTGDRGEIWQAVAPALILGAIIWIITDIMFRIFDFLAIKVFPKFEANIRMEMFEYVQDHSHSYFSNNLSGSLSNKIADMTSSATRILQLCITLFIPSLVAFFIMIVIFLFYHPLFALIMGTWVIFHIGISVAYAKRCNKLSEQHSESRSTLSGKIVDVLSNQINMKLFARKKYEYHFVQKQQNDEKMRHAKTLKVIAITRLWQGFLGFMIPGCVLAYTVIWSWQQGLISVGDVMYILRTSYGIMIMAWISGIELPNFFKEFGTCTQALSIIKSQHDIVEAEKAKKLAISKGEIKFDNVTFKYKRNDNVFNNKNITIAAGQKTGLVGFSGSGKTTFVNLILRLFDINKGKILIDGQNISKVTVTSLRESIAMIPQDPTMFHRSLYENIGYGKEGASKEEIIKAAKAAHCHEFIEQLENGYDTLVGERGIKLSGGQRQRIAIARAILKDAPILILDEATSALDSVTEADIQDSLNRLMQGRTTIVIAHRLSTLLGMDRILVFDKGEIVEDGSHKQLIKQNGHFARMWNMQAGGFLPEQK